MSITEIKAGELDISYAVDGSQTRSIGCHVDVRAHSGITRS
jgi:hypothetical protein